MEYILMHIKKMKTPITINITIEARELYDKLRKDGFILSNEVDKLIKEKAKVKLKKNGI